MIAIDALLTAEQKKKAYTPRYKLVFSKSGEDDITFEYPSDTKGIIRVKIEYFIYAQKIEFTIDNQDKSLTGTDYTQWTVTPYIGALCGGTAYYATRAPLLIYNQIDDSKYSNQLTMTYLAYGVFDQMEDDRASEAYFPDDTDTNTIKDYLIAIAGATLTCFSHCQAISITFDSEDDIIDTYIPKTAFRIYSKGSRFAAFRRLLEDTGCVARIDSDGGIHIFVPTTTGESYDFEFKSDDPDYLNVPEKSKQTNMVVPNYIVVKSQPEDDPQYEGSANLGYPAKSEKRAFYDNYKLSSNGQGDTIAATLLSRAQMNAQTGSYNGLMVSNKEVYDYVKLTDTRAGDSCTGNVGHLSMFIEPGKNIYNISFSFGGWFNIKGTLKDLENYGGPMWDFDRLSIKRLTINELYVTMDDIPNGEYFSKVNSAYLTAEGGLIINETATFGAGYDPSSKNTIFHAQPTTPYYIGDMWVDGTVVKRCIVTRETGAYTAADWEAVPVDDLADGVYSKILSTQVSAGLLKITSATIKDGEWYAASGVIIDADKGILIYGTDKAFVTRASVEGADQCYVGSDGAIYAGAGAIKLDANGFTVTGEGQVFRFYVGATLYGAIYTSVAGDDIVIGGVEGKGVDIYGISEAQLRSKGNVYIGAGVDGSGSVSISPGASSGVVNITKLYTTPVDVTDSRSFDNTYTNTTKPKICEVCYQVAPGLYGGVTTLIGGIFRGRDTRYNTHASATLSGRITFTVGAGEQYHVATISSGVKYKWIEITIG